MRFFAYILLLTSIGIQSSHADDASRVGSRLQAFELDDFRGKTWSSSDFADKDILVVAFVGTECPLVKLYSTRLAELAEQYGERGVQFIGINSNQQDSITEIAHFARVHGIQFPMLKDAGNVVADQFGAVRTPEIFVLDKQREVRYHGRIDDQYTYEVQRTNVNKNYLVDAIDELLAGKDVSTTETETVGCHIGRLLEPDPDSKVTYARQISRILQKRCVECHRDGEIAPFALTDYEEVVGWAEMIDEVVREQRMPPWHANPEHGEFANDARITDDEKELIYQWVEAGAPNGDPSNLPEPRQFAEGWRIGKPDLVIHMSEEPYQVPAEGEVKYQYFTVDPGFTEDKWIKAAECRPGNRAVVHHIIVAAGSRDRHRNQAHGDIESDWLTATAPGARPLILPDGMAKLIPAGSKLVFQMHYTPNGTAQTDRSSVGLIFADPKKVEKAVFTQKASNSRFKIPPFASDYPVEARYRFDQDSLLMAMFPHMHLRGKSFRYTAIYPDGNEEILLDVPNYDFNWQNTYEFDEPKRMPAGTLIRCDAQFDNSEDNLANPDPSRSVRWGDQTWEEMMIGYFDMALADQDLTKPQAAKTRTAQFLERVETGSVAVDPQLLTEASTALASNDSIERWGIAVRDIVPQIDRVDWMTVSDNRLRIERAAQSSRFRRQTGAGFSIPANGMRLAEYANGDQVVVHPRTADVGSPDFGLMSRVFDSSMHVPVTVSGKPGIISFWSREEEAFPAEAVEMLTKLGQALGKQ